MTDIHQSTTEVAGSDPTVDPATTAFNRSMVISGVRCALTYVIFPWVLPLVGITGGVGPVLGITVGLVAIYFNVASIRRFWGSDHRYKWPITFVNCGVIVLLTVLIGIDIGELA